MPVCDSYNSVRKFSKPTVLDKLSCVCAVELERHIVMRRCVLPHLKSDQIEPLRRRKRLLEKKLPLRALIDISGTSSDNCRPQAKRQTVANGAKRPLSFSVHKNEIGWVAGLKLLAKDVRTKLHQHPLTSHRQGEAFEVIELIFDAPEGMFRPRHKTGLSSVIQPSNMCPRRVSNPDGPVGPPAS